MVYHSDDKNLLHMDDIQIIINNQISSHFIIGSQTEGTIFAQTYLNEMNNITDFKLIPIVTNRSHTLQYYLCVFYKE